VTRRPGGPGTESCKGFGCFLRESRCRGSEFSSLSAAVDISHPPVVTGHILPRPPVIFSADPTGRSRDDSGFHAAESIRLTRRGVWHTTCFSMGSSKKNSQSDDESVNFVDRSAKTAAGDRGRAFRRSSGDRMVFGRDWCSNHGVARNGYRKRTRVRVACGVTIRPRGVGILSSHGQFGRLVVGRFLPLVVPEPVREELLRRRHLTSGPGLPAALTTRSVGFVRMSADADRTVRATRLNSAVVTRAASPPGTSAGVSGGWRRRTRPDPRTRLRTV
jgi:hypothetical protein